MAEFEFEKIQAKIWNNLDEEGKIAYFKEVAYRNKWLGKKGGKAKFIAGYEETYIIKWLKKMEKEDKRKFKKEVEDIRKRLKEEKLKNFINNKYKYGPKINTGYCYICGLKKKTTYYCHNLKKHMYKHHSIEIK